LILHAGRRHPAFFLMNVIHQKEQLKFAGCGSRAVSLLHRQSNITTCIVQYSTTAKRRPVAVWMYKGPGHVIQVDEENDSDISNSPAVKKPGFLMLGGCWQWVAYLAGRCRRN
jgi:hypothetical protein